MAQQLLSLCCVLSGDLPTAQPLSVSLPVAPGYTCTDIQPLETGRVSLNLFYRST